MIGKSRTLWRCVGMMLMIAALSSCHTSKKAGQDRAQYDRGTLHVGSGDAMRRHIVDEAMTWVGTPYRYAGLEKGVGVDCSGMVMRVYDDDAGMKIPRNSAKQAEFCERLEPKDVALGDLVFFATGKDPERVSHVGIIVDDNHFVHASTSKGVTVSDISSPYYQRTFIMYGRVPAIAGNMASN